MFKNVYFKFWLFLEMGFIKGLYVLVSIYSLNTHYLYKFLFSKVVWITEFAVCDSGTFGQ